MEYIRREAEVEASNTDLTITIHDYEDNAEIYARAIPSTDVDNMEEVPLLYLSMGRKNHWSDKDYIDFTYLELDEDDVRLLIKELSRLVEKM
jgi:hypothetical protein